MESLINSLHGAAISSLWICIVLISWPLLHGEGSIFSCGIHISNSKVYNCVPYMETVPAGKLFPDMISLGYSRGISPRLVISEFSGF